MKKHLLAICASAIVLSACGKETIIKEVLVTTPPETAAPYVAPEANKYDKYLAGLYENSAQARSWAESDLLEFGSIVCDAFSAGASLNSVLEVMSNYSSGSYDDDFFVAIIATAVTFLCPENLASVQDQLN